MAQPIITSTVRLSLTQEQIQIIKALLYFDVFDYPLTRDELFENSAIHISRETFTDELNKLLELNMLREEEGFILNTEGRPGAIAKRLHGNMGAKNVMPLAYEYSRKIARFPFVSGVCLSGGLSKNYYDEKGDIDFFIITHPKRLWICRSLLILRYKFLPKNKKKYWCTNYFISSDDIGIPDSNAFTATELAYLIPTINYTLYRQLLEKNGWYKTNFPNKREANAENCIDKPHSFLRSLVETLLGGIVGKWLDDLLLYVTLKHWQKKYPELSAEDFDLQFRSRKNVCKRHTKGFQNKVLQNWGQKQHAFEAFFKVSLQRDTLPELNPYIQHS